MDTSRRNLYALLIAAVSFILVIGAILTAVAESGFSPLPVGPATDTNIPIPSPTSGSGLATPILFTSTPKLSDTPAQLTPTQTLELPTVTPDALLGSPTVSVATFTATSTESVVCTTPTGWVTYKVQSGDTLFSIAVRYQTNFLTLQAGNCMGNSTKIITGSTLWVPNNPTITPTKTQVPTTTNIVCYDLTLSHNGNGSTPTASPQKSIGCNTGMYVAGEIITLTAAPSSGWTVGNWTGTANDSSTSTTNTLTMPSGNHTASVTYITLTCYTLTLSVNGSGQALTANPIQSPGCTAGFYTAGASVTLTASPSAGWEIASWTGTINNSRTATTNQVTMPASNHSASVTYQAICYTLTLTHTGAGSDPTASPTNSNGCPIGSFTLGENITLTALPASGGSVTGWTGTDSDNSTSINNTWTMQGNHTISVAYTP